MRYNVKFHRIQMMTSRILSYGFLSLVAVASVASRQSKVIVNDPDDRLRSVPTNWWTYSHQSPQDVTNTISSQNARIVDISVEQSAPSYLFTVTYVENAGPYYKPWLWSFGLDATTLANAISKNNAPLISLKAYDAVC